MDESREKLERQLGTMDRILVFLAVFLIIFTGCMITVFCVCQAVPDTLIVSVFSAAGLECGIMGAIKNRKEAIRAQIREIEEKEE